MTIRYKPAVVKRQLHFLQIETEKIETTKAKEVLDFAKSRIFERFVWKQLKEAVRLGEPLTVDGGGLFS